MPIDITARIEDDGLLRELERAPLATRKQAAKKVRAVSLAGEKRIKRDMPVDTGRARASWGHWTPGDVKNNPDAKASEAVFEISDGGLTVTQGSNVDYIADLNEGSSLKAPAGFIDAAAEIMGRILQEELIKIVRIFK